MIIIYLKSLLTQNLIPRKTKKMERYLFLQKNNKQFSRFSNNNSSNNNFNKIL